MQAIGIVRSVVLVASVLGDIEAEAILRRNMTANNGACRIRVRIANTVFAKEPGAVASPFQHRGVGTFQQLAWKRRFKIPHMVSSGISTGEDRRSTRTADGCSHKCVVE